MNWVRARALVLILLAGAVGCTLLLVSWPASSQRVYSIAAVQALLAHHRGDWGGQVIRIRGTVTTTQETFPCARPSCALVGIADSIEKPPASWLWLGQGAVNPFWNTLRLVPGVGRLAPVWQQPLVAQDATYAIRLLAHPDCAGMRCYDAVLLDSMPPAPPVTAPLIPAIVKPPVTRHGSRMYPTPPA